MRRSQQWVNKGSPPFLWNDCITLLLCDLASVAVGPGSFDEHTANCVHGMEVGFVVSGTIHLVVSSSVGRNPN
jgi:hypothetical protein